MKRIWNSLDLSRKFTIVILLFVIPPIMLVGVWMLSVQERNTMQEVKTYSRHTIERAADNVSANIDAVNMAVQFFLNDESLTDILEDAAAGRDPETDKLLEFFNSEISSLERLVNSNPILYAVRVYSVSDTIQEMMPVIYRQNRMNRQAWAQEGITEGWYFQYEDHLFSDRLGDAQKTYAAYIAPIYALDGTQIGTIEALTRMEQMFPTLYEDVADEWNVFLGESGRLYGNETDAEVIGSAVTQMLAESEAESDEEASVGEMQAGSRHCIVSAAHVRELGGSLLMIQDISARVQQNRRTTVTYMILLIFVAILLALIVHLIVRRLLDQFYQILKFIGNVQEGDLKSRIENCGTDEMGVLGSQINRMLDRIEKLMQDNLDREILLKNSEIRALQNQINTHFIYNVLESVKMLAEIDEEYTISDAITSLGNMLRYSMKWRSGNSMMQRELEYIENYVTLMNLRFDYQISLSVDVPDELMQQRIPKMSLQPIVENAVKHGIESIAEDTLIEISGRIEGEDCVMVIVDHGVGMSPETLRKVREKLAEGLDTDETENVNYNEDHGIGLKNVQDRLHIAFGSRYGLSFYSEEGSFTSVSVRIPYQKIPVGGEDV